jgi:hypothetical protein
MLEPMFGLNKVANRDALNKVQSGVAQSLKGSIVYSSGVILGLAHTALLRSDEQKALGNYGGFCKPLAGQPTTTLRNVCFGVRKTCF